MESRFKILLVGYRDSMLIFSTFLRSLKYLDFKILGIDIPEGCELIGVEHDFRRRAFSLLIYHPSFEIVPDYSEPPILDTIRARHITVEEWTIGKSEYIPAQDARSSHPADAKNSVVITREAFLAAIAPALVKKLCPDCNGKKVYQGLGKPEDCPTCKGKGEI